MNMKNRENRDITLHEKSMAIRAKSALAGKYSYKYLKHEVERTYDFDQYTTVDKDGKVTTVFRKTRISPSTRPNRKTIQETVHVVDPKEREKDDMFRFCLPKERNQNGIKHVIDVICDENESADAKITVLKQLIHFASYKHFYSETPEFITENNLQEQLEKCRDFANENLPQIEENQYFQSTEDIENMLEILNRLCKLSQDEEIVEK